MILLDVDPNLVKPGWTPLIITIVLAAVIALLMISMRRHMHRVELPYREEVAEAEREERRRARQSAAAASADPTADATSAPETPETKADTEAVTDPAGRTS